MRSAGPGFPLFIADCVVATKSTAHEGPSQRRGFRPIFLRGVPGACVSKLSYLEPGREIGGSRIERFPYHHFVNLSDGILLNDGGLHYAPELDVCDEGIRRESAFTMLP